MPLAHLCFSIHQQVKNIFPDFKRSHAYELVASFFGYASYSSLTHTAIQFIKIDTLALNNTCFNQRHVDLGMPLNSHIREIVSDAILSSNIFYLSLGDLSVQVRSSLEADNPMSSEVFGALLEMHETLPQQPVYPYLLAQYHDSSEYWDIPADMSYLYNKFLKGEEISPTFRRELDEFIAAKECTDKHIDYLERATQLGLFAAKKQLYEFLNYEEDVRGQPLLQNYQGKIDFTGFELEQAKRGDEGFLKEIFVELIEDKLGWKGWQKAHITADNLEMVIEAWKWHYFANFLKIDLLNSDLRAIHENGDAYDDDVGGSLYVVGRENIVLPALPAQSDAIAKKKSQDLIDFYTALNEFSFQANDAYDSNDLTYVDDNDEYD